MFSAVITAESRKIQFHIAQSNNIRMSGIIRMCTIYCFVMCFIFMHKYKTALNSKFCR